MWQGHLWFLRLPPGGSRVLLHSNLSAKKFVLNCSSLPLMRWIDTPTHHGSSRKWSPGSDWFLPSLRVIFTAEMDTEARTRVPHSAGSLDRRSNQKWHKRPAAHCPPATSSSNDKHKLHLSPAALHKGGYLSQFSPLWTSKTCRPRTTPPLSKRETNLKNGWKQRLRNAKENYMSQLEALLCSGNDTRY